METTKFWLYRESGQVTTQNLNLEHVWESVFWQLYVRLFKRKNSSVMMLASIKHYKLYASYTN
jgi:hypothetical protein